MIQKLTIAGFGAFDERTIELADGLTVLYGSNEAGKSTLSVFLKAMLYGLEDRRATKAYLPERQRYVPWNTRLFGGTLELRDAEGTPIRIERSFAAKGGKDQLRVSHADTGRTLELPASPGEALFGVGRETFEQTAFVGQNNAMVQTTDEMLSRLSNLFTGGVEDGSFEQALKKLEERRRTLYTKGAGQSGRLNLLQAAMAQLQQREQEAQQRASQERELLAQSREIAAQVTALEGQILAQRQAQQRYEAQTEAKEYQTILSLREQLTQLRQQIQEGQDQLRRGDFLADEPWVSQMNQQLMAYAQTERWLADQEQQCRGQGEQLAAFAQSQQAARFTSVCQAARQLQQEREELEQVECQWALLTPELNRMNQLKELLAQGEQDCPYFAESSLQRLLARPQRPDGLPMLMGFGAFALLFGALGLLQVVGTGLWGGTGLLAIGAALLAAGLLRWNIRRRRATESRMRGYESFEQMQEAYGAWQGRAAERAAARSELAGLQERNVAQRLETLSTRRQELMEHRAAVLHELELEDETRFWEEAEAAQKQLTSAANRRAQLQLRQEELQSRRQTQQLAAQELSAQSQTAFGEVLPVAQLAQRVLKVQQLLVEQSKRRAAEQTLTEHERNLVEDKDLDAMAAAYEQYRSVSQNQPYDPALRDLLTAQLQAAGEKRAALQERLSHQSGETVAQVQEQMEAVREQARRARLQLAAVELAQSTIEEAKLDLERNFAPKLRETTRRNLSIITGGSYEELSIDKDCNVQLRDSQGRYHALSCFSAGTITQTYIALRLALLELIEGPVPMPLIFDDAFYQFDNQRLALCLDALWRLSSRRQILILTCHTREEELLGGREGVSCIRLG